MKLPIGGHRIEEKFGGFKSESQAMPGPAMMHHATCYFDLWEPSQKWAQNLPTNGSHMKQ